jgi:hypothetical protein
MSVSDFAARTNIFETTSTPFWFDGYERVCSMPSLTNGLGFISA